MVLHMPGPTKRKGSDNWYFRLTIPADVRHILEELPPEQRPRNWYKTHISISLRTADRSVAKANWPEVAARVERQMQALRQGPKPLTVKQITALSGEMYKAFAETVEPDPVLSPEQWRDVAEGNRLARSGRHMLGIYRDDAERREAAMERQFGGMADTLLNHRNIVTDEASRWKLIEQLSKDMPVAAEKLARNADGDFSPDTYRQRFPAFESAADKAPPDAPPETIAEHGIIEWTTLRLG